MNGVNDNFSLLWYIGNSSIFLHVLNERGKQQGGKEDDSVSNNRCGIRGMNIYLTIAKFFLPIERGRQYAVGV